MLYKEAALILREELVKEAGIMGGLSTLFGAVKTGVKTGFNTAKQEFKIRGLASKASKSLESAKPMGSYSTLVQTEKGLKPGQTFYSSSPAMRGESEALKLETPITTNEGKLQKATGTTHNVTNPNVQQTGVVTTHNETPVVNNVNNAEKATNTATATKAEEPGLWDQTKQWWGKRTTLEKGLMIGGGGALAGLGIARALDNGNNRRGY